MCEVVGVYKRKNYTRCQQLEVQGDRMTVLSEKRMEVHELLSGRSSSRRERELNPG